MHFRSSNTIHSSSSAPQQLHIALQPARTQSETHRAGESCGLVHRRCEGFRSALVAMLRWAFVVVLVATLVGLVSNSTNHLLDYRTRHAASASAKALMAGVVDRLDFSGSMQSPADNRIYRALTLESGLQILLISDPDADTAGAAMDVRAGSFNDPEDAKGLAHYLEHSLFLGTAKYPRENEFSLFLSQHGGNTNAFTSHENTNYFYSIDPEFLSGSLERFVQFFSAPSLQREVIGRELNAVHSEYLKNLNSDGWRLTMMLRNAARPTSPLSAFSSGNMETLKTWPEANGVDIRERMRGLHDCLYTPQNMKLVVAGPHAVDVLQEMVLHSFGGVQWQNASVSPSSVECDRYRPVRPVSSASSTTSSSGGGGSDDSLTSTENVPDTLPFLLHGSELFHVSPLKDIHLLRLVFPIPSLHRHWKSKPISFVTSLLNGDTRGSLAAVLREAGWVSELRCSEDSTSSYGMFNIVMTLSPEGVGHVDSIVEAFFLFIRLISRDKSDWPWRWHERQALHDMEWRFLQKDADLDGFASYLAEKMQLVRPDMAGLDLSLLLRLGQYLEYNETVIDELLSALHPNNMMVLLMSQHVQRFVDSQCNGYNYDSPEDGSDDAPVSFLRPPNPVCHVERYFDVEYTRGPAPAAVAQLWLDAVESPVPSRAVPSHARFQKLALPPRNVYVPEDFRIRHTGPASAPCPDDISNASSMQCRPPAILLQSEHMTVYFKTDTTFLQPRGCVYLKIVSAQVEKSSRHALLSSLLVALVEESLREDLDAAGVAGLSADLDSGRSGVSFYLCGYSDHLDRLLLLMLDRFLSLRAHPDPSIVRLEQRFSVIREEEQRSAVNFLKRPAYAQAKHFVTRLVGLSAWTQPALLRHLQNVSFAEVLAFGPSLLSSIFTEVLIHGNWDLHEAVELSGAVAGRLNSSSILLPEDRPVLRIRAPPEGNNVVMAVSSLNEEEKNGAVFMLIPCGPTSPRLTAMTHLLVSMLEDHAFAQLRTKEQLGYLVHSGYVPSPHLESMAIMVQSASEKGTSHVDHRIRRFLWHIFPRVLGVTTVEDPLASADDTSASSSEVTPVVATKQEAMNEQQVDADAESNLPPISEASFAAFLNSTTRSLLEKDKKLSSESHRWWHELGRAQAGSPHAPPLHWQRETAILEALQQLTLHDVRQFYADLMRQRRSVAVWLMQPNELSPRCMAASGGDDTTPPRMEGDAYRAMGNLPPATKWLDEKQSALYSRDGPDKLSFVCNLEGYDECEGCCCDLR